MDFVFAFIIGGGGHAKVLLDCLRFKNNIHVKGILDIDRGRVGHSILGITVLGHEDEILKKYTPGSIKLINGVGSIGLTTQREKIFNKFKEAGFHFLSVIHPTVYIGAEVSLGEGVQLMAGCTIQPGCSIGNNVIINTHAAIDHDSKIADHVHIAPGVTCCGEVSIGMGSHIGCGAVIRQGIQVGERSLIAAGSVVVHDIGSHSKVAGVPAKSMEELRKNEQGCDAPLEKYSD